METGVSEDRLLKEKLGTDSGDEQHGSYFNFVVQRLGLTISNQEVAKSYPV